MSGGSRSNPAESLRQRLRNELRARREDPSLGLQRYAVERLLYRLGRSRHRERFILKGATLFAVWGNISRPTQDIDFTDTADAETEKVVAAFSEICSITEDESDALRFDVEQIDVEYIREQSEYGGLRLKLHAYLDTSRIPIQVDIGFGDAIVPAPEEMEYRTILGDPPPRILGYPPESVIAEKLHAIVSLGAQNSRMKDFYDINAIAQAFRFERSLLTTAVRATFVRRATLASLDIPVALTTAFYVDATRALRWRAFINTNRLSEGREDFGFVGERIMLFLRPVWNDFAKQSATRADWPAGGPWR